MSMAIWTELPELDGFDYSDILPVAVFAYTGMGTEQRAALLAIGRRQYTWPLRRTKTEKLTVDDFFRLRNYQVTAFLVTDPHQHARTGVSLGTSVAAQVAFPIPTTGENTRDYPTNDANVVVYDDGVSVTVSDTDPDLRKFTLAVAPTSGSVMTADYHYYRRVRLLEPFTWSQLAPDFFQSTVRLLEVPV